MTTRLQPSSPSCRHSACRAWCSALLVLFAAGCGSENSNVVENGAGATPVAAGGGSAMGGATTGSGGSGQSSSGGSAASTGGTETGGGPVVEPPPGTITEECEGTDSWYTFGRDERRSSAAPGSITWPLRAPAWSLKPAGAHVNFALATECQVFVQSAKLDLTRAESATVIDARSADDSAGWQKASALDSTRAGKQWPMLAEGSVLTHRRGLWAVSQDDGSIVANEGHAGTRSSRGPLLPASERFFAVSLTSMQDTPMFIGAYRLGASQHDWREMVAGSCELAATNWNGATAMDAGSLFFVMASVCVGTACPEGGLYALEPSTGKELWKRTEANIRGPISAGNGLIYGIEYGNERNRLTARRQGDGSVAWSEPVALDWGQQVPVLAGDLVVISTDTGIFAYDARKGGEPRWETELEGVNVTAGLLPYVQGCNGKNGYQDTAPDTRLAAALGSATLVATGSSGQVHVLRLQDGKKLGTRTIDGAGQLRNPVIVGNRLYVMGSFNDNRLYALESQ